MPQYLDANGNPIPAPQTGQKTYLDANTGEPIAASAVPDTQQPGIIDEMRNFADTAFSPNTNGSHPIENTLLGAAHGISNMVLHPVKSLLENGSVPGNYPGMAYTGYKPADEANANNPATDGMVQNAQSSIDAAKKNPAYAIGSVAGPLLATAGVAKGIKVAPETAGAIREAALGNPDAAALRGLHVSPRSPKALATIDSVEGSRPFLQGVKGQADLQARVPVAKAEIWQPYEDALSKIGDNKVKGPDGAMTTVQALEDRRLELSAQLRTLKSGGPEATALAQQKGLTVANLLREESQVKSALDPQLRQVGIDPTAIRKAFAQVSKVGKTIAGKTTVGEASQPYGFGRMTNVALDTPRTWIGEPVQGVRDLLARRPLWSANPTDLNIREAFRAGGPKPDFTVPVQASPRIAGMLPAHTGGPIELPYVPEMSGGERLAALMQELRKSSQKALPATAGSGAPTILPYTDMTAGEQLAALMQYLRKHPQAALPAKASAIRLPPSR